MRCRLILFLLALLTPVLLGFSSVGYAEVKEILAEGTYCMGDGETPTVAEEHALLNAKRTALEQAGTYVQSYSEIKNYQLTADEVQVIASGIMEVTVLDKHRVLDGNNIDFWVKIRALVTTDKIEDMAAKVKELPLTEDYKKLQEDYEKSQQEVASLRQQLQQADNDNDRQRIRSQITDSEAVLHSTTLFDQGNRLMDNHEYYEAINAYTEAISINPRFGKAYFRRGAAHNAVGECHEAIEDFDRAIDINPQLTLAYFGKGRAYEKMGHRHKAIEAYRLFIEYATPDQQSYVDRAKRRIWMLESSDTFAPAATAFPRIIFFRRRGIYR